MDARIAMIRYMVDYNAVYSDKVKSILKMNLNKLGAEKSKEIEKIVYFIEDFFGCI